MLVRRDFGDLTSKQEVLKDGSVLSLETKIEINAYYEIATSKMYMTSILNDVTWKRNHYKHY